MTSTTDANTDTPGATGTPGTYGELRAQLATLTTEAFRPELAEIDRLSTEEIARIMNGEDATVPAAVAERLPQMEDSKELAAADLDALKLTADDTVVGISASGRTPYAIGAVEHARARGALTIGLSCNADSALAAAAEHGLEVVTGPELLTGSTRLKAGTAQKLVLNMISTVTMIRLGKTYGNLMVDVRASNEKLRARSRHIVSLATGASDTAIEAALAATDGEVKNAILVILGQVDGPTAARLLTESAGHLRAALAAV
ncbi:N-acetylmuramic acid 6-phosphate etherase, partial [Streptomyces sp. BF-3]